MFKIILLSLVIIFFILDNIRLRIKLKKLNPKYKHKECTNVYHNLWKHYK